MSEYVYGTDGHEGHWLTGEEIVRCRDCRHFVEDATPYDIGFENYCTQHGSDFVKPDGFCSWGDRKDNKSRTPELKSEA